MKVGESYTAEDKKQYHCVHGNDGTVRMEYGEAVQTVTQCSLPTNQSHKVNVGEKTEIDGATFVCQQSGPRTEWNWTSGGFCNVKDGSKWEVNEGKREGDVTHKCVRRGFKFVISVTGM